MSRTPLKLTNITKTYSGVTALKDVSFEVREGEVHALLGENGAGKSTLMNVASGTTQPDEGIIEINGEIVENLNPIIATEKGLAIVHQHPAVLPDLSIAENIRISVPEEFLKSEGTQAKTMRKMLDDFGFMANLNDRVETLTVAQKHLLDLAKAFAVKPKVLVLDEPTAPLGQESVEILFDRVNQITKQGTAVIYITHRLAEVRALANRVTVLRDGKWRATSNVSEVSDDEIMKLIVGRELESTFPNKHSASSNNQEFFKVQNFSSHDFHEVSISAKRGEIIGISGVVGNGQSDLLRALAGLSHYEGEVLIDGHSVSHSDLLKHTAYLPADRHGEALMMTMSVRENAAISALRKFAKLSFISRTKETKVVLDSLTSLAVKAPSMDASVSSLSGGNQQKIVMSRSLLSTPTMIIADEPTQGVDVGARAEIYQILRDVAEDGIPVIVNSSDTKELEGLCDRVYVMSRGHIVKSLEGNQITEENMVSAAVQSTTLKKQIAADNEKSERSGRLNRFLQGDYIPPSILALIMLILGAYVTSKNHSYIGNFNINAILGLVAALGFIAIGQSIVLMTGGIDLSVGPAAGFLLCFGSLFINDGKSGITMFIGFILMFVIALLIGMFNAFLIRYAKFTPIAATLSLYIGLIGFSYLLRPAPDGYINGDVTNILLAKIGPIPYVFILLVIISISMELALRRSFWGLRLRASGSNEESARRLGVNINRTIFGAYAASTLFAAIGAIMLMSILGVGDAAQGSTYTLQSITAAVLGGTSLLGGRGSFIGTLFGSVVMIQVLNATTLLDLSQTWQYIFQGLLVVIAAVMYTLTRRAKAGGIK